MSSEKIIIEVDKEDFEDIKATVLDQVVKFKRELARTDTPEATKEFNQKMLCKFQNLYALLYSQNFLQNQSEIKKTLK